MSSLPQENLQDWFNDKKIKIHQAICLNLLRQAKIEFLNLGNLVYCPKQKLLLIFKAKILQRCDQIEYDQIFA